MDSGPSPRLVLSTILVYQLSGPGPNILPSNLYLGGVIVEIKIYIQIQDSNPQWIFHQLSALENFYSLNKNYLKGLKALRKWWKVTYSAQSSIIIQVEIPTELILMILFILDCIFILHNLDAFHNRRNKIFHNQI